MHVSVRALHGFWTWTQILERVAREELDVPVLKPRHSIKVLYIYMSCSAFNGDCSRHSSCAPVGRSWIDLTLPPTFFWSVSTVD